MQVIGDGAHMDVALRRQMPDRNQGRVFDAGEADDGGVAFAQGLVADQKAEQAVDEAAELGVRNRPPAAPDGRPSMQRGTPAGLRQASC